MVSYPQAKEVLDFVMGNIAEGNLRETRSKRKQLLISLLGDKFGFTPQEASKIVDITFRGLDSIPIVVIDPHELYRTRGFNEESLLKGRT